MDRGYFKHRREWPRLMPWALVGIFLSLWPVLLMAATSVLIWPVDPHMNANDRSVALWLENHGDQPVALQIRVLAWQQHDHTDGYSEQSGIQASPPIATIAPGKRQMVRLIQMAPAPAGGELAYRVLVDEIPRASAPADTQSNGMGIRFQLRYSVPLFVYGAGLWVHNPIDKDGPGKGAEPQLSLRVASEADGRVLYISNHGVIHARLARASLLDAKGKSTALATGLLGYVLPGAELRVALPAGFEIHAATLQAKVNDEVQPWSMAIP